MGIMANNSYFYILLKKKHIMKKTLFFCFILFITLQVSAQRVTVDNVPDEVSKAFKAKFSIAEKTTWVVADDYYEADFKVSKVDFTATFDRAGKWIKTAKFMKASELPKSVKDAITKEFGQLSGYTYEDVERVENEKEVVYMLNIKKGELMYDIIVSEKGEMIKKEEKQEKQEG